MRGEEGGWGCYPTRIYTSVSVTAVTLQMLHNSLMQPNVTNVEKSVIIWICNL